MGTEQGLYVFDINTKKFVSDYTHASTLTSQNSLPATGIGEVFFDGENQLWIGTGSGLYTLNFNQLPIRTFYFPQYEMRDVLRIREDIKSPSLLWLSVYWQAYLVLINLQEKYNTISCRARQSPMMS